MAFLHSENPVPLRKVLRAHPSRWTPAHRATKYRGAGHGDRNSNALAATGHLVGMACYVSECLRGCTVPAACGRSLWDCQLAGLKDLMRAGGLGAALCCKPAVMVAPLLSKQALQLRGLRRIALRLFTDCAFRGSGFNLYSNNAPKYDGDRPASRIP